MFCNKANLNIFHGVEATDFVQTLFSATQNKNNESKSKYLQIFQIKF